MRPLVVIVGTTGVGKSDLAIHLARRFNGEVINGDSMQVYDGLNVITNKMPPAERRGVPHHLMDFLTTREEFTVKDFLPAATNTIDEIHARGNLPILVGGTNYYIQALIWKDGLSNSSDVADAEQPLSPSQEAILDGPVERMFKELCEVDPTMATRWHPNDVRKIRRSLEVFYSTGQKHSDLIRSTADIGLRYRTCTFWLYAQQNVLDERLDRRVDDMIEQGLFDEISSLRKEVGTVDYTRGIFQSIGYKEFDQYFISLEKGEKLDELRSQGLEQMKMNTRRYARRQVKWIRNKLVPACQTERDLNMYVLDATDLSEWADKTTVDAANIAKAFVEKAPLPDPVTITPLARELLSAKENLHSTAIDTWKKFTCETCSTDSGYDVVLNGQKDWQAHLRSKVHIRIRDKDKRLQEIQHLRAEATARQQAKSDL